MAKYLYCPACNKQHKFDSLPQSNFSCSQCGAKINPNLFDLQYPYRRISQPQPSTRDYSGAVGFAIAVVAIIAYIIWRVFINGNSNQTVSSETKLADSNITSQNRTEVATTQVSPPNIVSTPPPPTTQKPEVPSSSTLPGQLCSVQLINTMRGTNKAGLFRATMNEASKVLTLTYLNDPQQVLELDYEGDGKVLAKMLTAGKLQVAKELIRRPDLESKSTEIIYYSRTEEVQLTITYDN